MKLLTDELQSLSLMTDDKMLLVQIPASKLKRLAIDIQEFYRRETRDIYSEKTVIHAIFTWFARFIENVEEDADDLFLAPHRAEAQELRSILEESRKAAAESDFLRVVQAQTVVPEAETSGNIFTGFREYSSEKLKSMISYVTRNGQQIFKTKMNKLLFYADFVNFYLNGHSISGANYVHLPFGPVPDGYEAILEEMVKLKTIEIRKLSHSKTGAELFRSGKVGANENLTIEERRTLAWVLKNYGTLSTNEIVNLSHVELAYKNTQDGEKIAYGYAQFLKKLPEIEKNQ